MPPVALAALTIALTLPSFGWPAATFDEQVLLVNPLRMMDGDLPFRDFSTVYGPVTYWLLQALYTVSSPTVLVERLLGSVVHVALVTGLYGLVAPLGRRQAMVGAAIAALLLFPLGAAPYAWLLMYSLTVWGLFLLRRGGASQAALAGLLQGLALGARPDAALLVLAPSLPLLQVTRHRLLPWLAGLVVGSVPMAVMALLTHGAMVRDILDRAARGAGQSSLPWWPSAGEDRILLCVLLASVVLLVAWAARTRTAHAVSLALLAGIALAAPAQRMDSTHLLYAGLLSFPLLPTALRELMKGIPGTRRVLGSVCAVGVLTVGTGPVALRPLLLTVAGDGPAGQKVSHDGRELMVTPDQAQALRALLDVLDRVAPPGARLFVYSRDFSRPEITDLAVYYLSPRLRQHAHTIDVTPGISNAPGSPLADDVAWADVIVLVDEARRLRDAPFPRAKQLPTQAAVDLRRRFALTRSVEFYEVWLPRSNTREPTS